MQAVQKIAVLFFLGVGITKGQDEGLLGLPVDFDDFGLDFRSIDLYKDQDIFKDDADSENTYISPEETIRSLCNEYDLILNDQRIDCKNIKLAQKLLKIDEHNIHKRDVNDETQLEEGSGAGEESAPDSPTNEEEPIPEQTVEEPKQNDTAPSEPDGVNPSEDLPSGIKEEEPAAELPVAEPEAELPVAEPAVELPVADPAPELPVENPEVQPEGDPSGTEAAQEEGKEGVQPKEESPAENAVEESVVAAPEVKKVESEAKETEVTTEPTPVKSTEGEQKGETSAATESAVVKQLNAAEVDGIKKKGRMYRPDATEADKAKESAENTEQVKEHQSGIAVLQSPGKETLEATDDAVGKMQPNAKLKEASSDPQEKTGESAKEVKQGRKDTKVLIVLFVAVVVVGCAAFAYNFIKKRKQKKAEATENGGNNTTQNSAKVDPEQGTELKPLMKNADQKPVVAEYTDEKDNVQTEEGK